MKLILGASALFFTGCLLSCDEDFNTSSTNGTVLAESTVSAICPQMMGYSVQWRNYTNNTNLAKEVTVILDALPVIAALRQTWY